MIPGFPLLYEEVQWVNFRSLTDHAQGILIPAIEELLVEMGFELFKQFVYELKFKKE